MAATPPATVHYNWHPLVHKRHFHERLYFVMIRLQDPLHKPVAEQVRSLLDSAGVDWACEYTLFGWHDALVRVWLKPPAYLRFLEALPPDVLGFTVSEVRYLWRGNHDLLASDGNILRDIVAKKEDIDKVAKDPDATHSDSWRELFGRKLVFKRPPTGDGVKFYTVLERTSDRISTSDQIAEIQRALSSTPVPNSRKSMAASASLYCGDGKLGDYLVRCVAPTYNDVLTLVERFDIELADAHVRPLTLIVANPDPREYDHPNDPVHLSLDDETTAEMLGVPPRLLNGLDDHHRLELRHLVDTAFRLADNDTVLRDHLLAMLRATVLGTANALNEAYGFLVEFEGVFGSLVLTGLGDSIGRKWFGQLKDWCAASSTKRYRDLAVEMEAEEPETEWNLGTYKFLALAGAEFHPACKGYFEEKLRSAWPKEVDAFEKRRNDFAHSRLHKRFRGRKVYDRATAEYLERHMKAAVFWQMCVEVNETVAAARGLTIDDNTLYSEN